MIQIGRNSKKLQRLVETQKIPSPPHDDDPDRLTYNNNSNNTLPLVDDTPVTAQ
jgi:hypothetical protein